MERERFTTLANKHGKFRCDTLIEDIKIPRQSKKHPGKGRICVSQYWCQGAPAHTCKFTLNGLRHLKIYRAISDGRRYRYYWR